MKRRWPWLDRSIARTGLRKRRAPIAHAARVAAAATVLLAVVYVAAAIVLNLLVTNRLTSQVDASLAGDLASLTAHRPEKAHGASSATGHGPTAHGGADDDDSDLDGEPIVTWIVDAPGRGSPARPGVPALPAGSWSDSEAPTTAAFAGTVFRLQAAPFEGHWIVVGQSTTADSHVVRVLELAEAAVGPIVLIAAFGAALAIGVRAIAPVEQARRRQLEFTADASHELRTPLTVIEAEIGLALGPRGDDASHRAALTRVRAEGLRLRRIVEDLLWLARVDSAPPRPADEPVDLWSIAEACTERFVAVAAEREMRLQLSNPTGRCWVVAPPEWVDRLVGVLVDNACRFAGTGGTVRVAVTSGSGRVVLSVEDSGPGVPIERRAQLFDRFHRAVEDNAGYGLGLAIADAVVQATGGRWGIGDSDLGGARFDVTWRAR